MPSPRPHPDYRAFAPHAARHIEKLTPSAERQEVLVAFLKIQVAIEEQLWAQPWAQQGVLLLRQASL